MRTTLTRTLALTLLLTAGSQIRAAQKINLQFRPTPADKQTLRVTSALDMSMKMGDQQQTVTNVRTITLALEPVETATDGTVTVRVRFVAIQEKGGIKGVESGTAYDSTKPQDDSNPLAQHYSAFIGEDFPIKVSSTGDIVDLGTDELFLAVAGNLMEKEDKTMRERLREKADQAIERTNQRLGSREKRKQALKEQVEKFPLLNRSRIQGLLGDVLVCFPKDPVQAGESWQAPITVNPGAPFEITGTYTLKAAEQGRCTIEVHGQRSMEDKPIVSQIGPAPTSMKLAGSYTTVVTADPKTGLLLSRRTQMKFAGETQAPDPKTQGGSVQTTLEGTTTVERVEPPVSPKPSSSGAAGKQ